MNQRQNHHEFTVEQSEKQEIPKCLQIGQASVNQPKVYSATGNIYIGDYCSRQCYTLSLYTKSIQSFWSDGMTEYLPCFFRVSCSHKIFLEHDLWMKEIFYCGETGAIRASVELARSFSLSWQL